MPLMATDKLPTLVATSGDPLAEAYVPDDIAFEFEQREFLTANALEQMGEKLIMYHDLNVAENVIITYLWKRKGGVTSGRATLGKCIKTSGMVKYFAAQTRRRHVDYVIWLAADNVRDAGLAAWQLEALLYHELLHISTEIDKNDELKLSIVGHDWEGFNAEINAYGLWWSDLEKLGERVLQLKLGGLDKASAKDGITMIMSAGERH